jgi:ParB/RepB/Spo0J family partition protein
MKIPLNKIQDGPSALRKVNKESEAYLGIVQSMKELAAVGKEPVLQPIIVRPAENGTFVLVDGLHRRAAAIDAGLMEIECVVREGDTDEDALVLQVIANMHRVDTKPVEYARQIHRILGLNPDGKITVADLAKKFSQSESWIKERLNLVKLPQTIADIVDDTKKRMPLQNAIALSKLPENEMEQYLKDAMTSPCSEFIPKVNARLKDIKSAKEKGLLANPPKYEQVPMARKFSELQNELATMSAGKALLTKHNVKSTEEAYKMALIWATNMDSITGEIGKAKFDAKEKEKAELREKRAQEAIVKKQAEMAKKQKESDEAIAKLEEIQKAQAKTIAAKKA